MTKLPLRVPTSCILLAVLSLGIMPTPSAHADCWQDGQHESV